MTLGRDQSWFELAFDAPSVQRLRQNVTTAYLRAAFEAVSETGRDLEKAYEAATEGAGLGRLAKAWQSRAYPKSGRAYEPSSVVFASGQRAELALKAYATGGTFRQKDGMYFAIPTRAAGVRYTGRRKAFITPGEWERRTGLKLRLIYRRRGPSFLVTDGVTGRKSGIVAKTATQRRLEQGRATQTIVVFLLIPKFTVKQRFNTESIARPYGGRLRDNFTRKVAGLAV